MHMKPAEIFIKKLRDIKESGLLWLPVVKQVRCSQLKSGDKKWRDRVKPV